jgi:hypothetical protein
MAGLPVSSNKLGVIHGCVAAVRKRWLKRRRWMVTHLEDEPPSEIDAADWLRTIRKAREKGMLGIPSDAECGEKGDEEQRGKHWRSWQMAKEGGREKKREGKERKKWGKWKKATIELEKKDVKRMPWAKHTSFLTLHPPPKVKPPASRQETRLFQSNVSWAIGRMWGGDSQKSNCVTLISRQISGLRT